MQRSRERWMLHSSHALPAACTAPPSAPPTPPALLSLCSRAACAARRGCAPTSSRAAPFAASSWRPAAAGVQVGARVHGGGSHVARSFLVARPAVAYRACAAPEACLTSELRPAKAQSALAERYACFLVPRCLQSSLLSDPFPSPRRDAVPTRPPPQAAALCAAAPGRGRRRRRHLAAGRLPCARHRCAGHRCAC